jgi:hypothetical protein
MPVMMMMMMMKELHNTGGQDCLKLALSCLEQELVTRSLTG